MTQPALGALPAYVQISEAIARDIHAGRLLDGEKLPTERALAEAQGVAVGTLRKALSLLEDQGLIERVQGSGNYIRHSEDAENIYAFFRLELLEGGGLPTAKILSLDLLPKPEEAPNFGPAEDAWRFRRLRYLSGQPAAVEEIWLDGDAADDIRVGDVSESLYHFYKSHLKLWISRAEDRVSLSPAPDWTVDQFGKRPGESCGFVERISYDSQAKPIEFSRNWFDPAVATYVSRLK